MRTARHIDEVNALLERDGVITVGDFFAACQDMPRPSVYARIRALVQSGRLTVVGKGKYISRARMAYKLEITPWMQEVNAFLIEKCPGVNHCISERGKNLLVEVSKPDIHNVVTQLKTKYDKVLLRKDSSKFAGFLEGCILVDSLISEAPIEEIKGVSVPTLEKTLVDSLRDSDAESTFRKAFDVFPINQNRMARYAARRGVSAELNACLATLNTDRINMFEKVRRYLSTIPVEKAWVFGSFSRGEETPESDLDLLVTYEDKRGLSLLTIIHWQLDIEKLIGRDVDLIEDGSLRPFAIPSANHDKYLIYEKQN